MEAGAFDGPTVLLAGPDVAAVCAGASVQNSSKPVAHSQLQSGDKGIVCGMVLAQCYDGSGTFAVSQKVEEIGEFGLVATFGAGLADKA